MILEDMFESIMCLRDDVSSNYMLIRRKCIKGVHI